MLDADFFDRDTCEVAQALLGKVIYARYQRYWLSARIIETEAYYQHEKASHASLGYTEKRKALFMPPGTIYMYYARGGDSLNISCQGEGNAVLIKSALALGDAETIAIMRTLNPVNGRKREKEKLCSGQTLLCRSLHLKVKRWDQQQFDQKNFYIAETAYQTQKIIQTTRLGIAKHRDPHLPYRFIDYHHAHYCTRNPLRQRVKNFKIIEM
ncbi:MAG: DNA-3-methyladenine glycosylase [Pseudomonadota bacterium]